MGLSRNNTVGAVDINTNHKLLVNSAIMNFRYQVLKNLSRSNHPPSFGLPKRNFSCISRRLQENQKIKSGLHLKSMFPISKIIKYGVISFGAVSITISASLLGFFIYDATTYPENTWEDVFSPEEVLNPKRGGPENLPIMNVNLDKIGTTDLLETKSKPRLVILGSGWATAGILKSIKADEYEVTVISPTNYFLFTPLLPSAATFTLDVKSLKVPLRKLLKRLKGHFVEGWAEKVEIQDNLVKVTPSRYSLSEVGTRSKHFWTSTSESLNLNEKEDYEQKAQILQERAFYVPYDKLIVAVGASLNTHGVEGLEYCSRLKSAKDVVDIRKKIKANFELASLPTTTEKERKRLLSFVVAGGGATGCEFAAEVSDMINEEVSQLYSKLIRRDCSIHIIQSRQHILNTYDKAISEFTERKFSKDNIDVQTNSRVKKVLPDRIIYTQANENNETVEKEIPFGVCLWSTGLAQNTLSKSIVESLGTKYQSNKYALETDSQLRVIGCDNVYCIGDASNVKLDMPSNAVKDLKAFFSNKNEFLHNHKEINDLSALDDSEVKKLIFSDEEIKNWTKYLAKKYPSAIPQFQKVGEFMKKYDHETKVLEFSDLVDLLTEIETKVPSLPLTAQRALQQGEYLGKELHKLSKTFESELSNNQPLALNDDALYKPFKYRHMGSLAYIGNSAVFDFSGYTFFGGLLAMYLWRSVYFSQSVSIESRFRLFNDWLYRGLFGRDLSVEE